MKQIKDFFQSILQKQKTSAKEKIDEKFNSSTILFTERQLDEDFYSTVKLKSGEELFAKVMASKEDDKIVLILNSPITISEIKGRRGVAGYKVEPWLKTIKQDLIIIDIENVLSLIENTNIEMISMYEKFNCYEEDSNRTTDISRRMGYISSVSDAKKILENLYNNS